MSLSDEKAKLVAKLRSIEHDRAVTVRQLNILEQAAIAMAEAEHDTEGTPGKPPVADAPNHGGRPLQSRHPFVLRCVEMGLTVKGAASLLGVPPATLRSWYVDGNDGRTIPDRFVERLSKAPWDVPASAWKRRE